MDASTIPMVRPLWKKPDDVIRDRVRGIRGVIEALQEVSRILVESDELLDRRRAGWIQGLIRVEDQDPPALGSLDRMIAGGGEINDVEIEGNHFRPVAGRNA